MTDRFNTIAGWVLFAGIVMLGSSIVAGEAFNIACGGRYTLLELLARMNESIGSNIEAIHEEARSGDVRDSQAAIDAARDALGYQISVGFEEGLRRTIEWYRAEQESASEGE